MRRKKRKKETERFFRKKKKKNAGFYERIQHERRQKYVALHDAFSLVFFSLIAL